MSTTPTPFTSAQIQAWLTTKLATTLAIADTELDIREPFQSLGITSRQAVSLSGELEDWLACTLEPTLLWDYPDIETLAHYLAHHLATSQAKHIPPVEQPQSLFHIVQTHKSKDQPAEPYPHMQAMQREPIAIIGLGCRFPGAQDPHAFWHLLCTGTDAISEVPPDRWSLPQFYDADPTKPGKMNTRWGGFLKDVDQFDAHFFGISPREAERMDPQQRLLLEVAWEALEDAGQPIEALRGSATGVFIGIATNDYARMQLDDINAIDAYAGTGTAFSIAANRLSYFFDWYGPSMAIDTACSSSLVAVHTACQSIWCGDASIALAGGANLLLSPEYTIHLTKAGAMAPDGRCKTFDRRADGYVRGEGVGIVVLKPLSQAHKDHDPIYALIRGSAINQDGRTNGLMAPNRISQERMLRQAYQHAGIAPQDVQFVEAHGTGTFLGDPIEALALGNVLGPGRDSQHACIIGSVKTNIGHLEAAAGIAGLIKVCLMLQHHQIPPSLHFQEPNPHIPFEQLALRVATTLEAWPEQSEPLSAGISAFGFGGTNAHLVLSTVPHIASIAPILPTEHDSIHPPTSQQAQILPLSARSIPALQTLAQRYSDFLGSQDRQDAANWTAICATASTRRSHHDQRLAIVAQSSPEAREQLHAWLTTAASVNTQTSARSRQGAEKIVFVFSGQGSQWLGMGTQLWQQEPIFRHALEECQHALSPYLTWSLYDKLSAAPEDAHITDVDVLQVLIFVIAIGLAKLWQAWGIEPAAVIGHSMGEVAAAYIAGSLSLQDACHIIYARSTLQRRVQGRGAMLALDLTYEQGQQVLQGYEQDLAIAAINGPTELVIGGDTQALAQLHQQLQRQDVACRYIHINVAAHTPHMESLRLELETQLASIQPRAGTIPIYSTVSARAETGANFHAHYWGQNMREPVHFAQTLAALLQDGYKTFLEVSPHPLLTHTIQQALAVRNIPGHALHSLRRQRPERCELLTTLATLYTNGQTIAWEQLFPYPHHNHPYISLPTYPWQHQRFWLHTDRTDNSITSSPTTTPTPTTQHTLDPQAANDHQPQPHNLITTLQLCETDQQRLELLRTHLREQLAHILHLPIQHIETHKPLTAMGLDSIMALELKRNLETTLQRPLSMTLVWKYPTIDALSAYFLPQLKIMLQ